MGLGHPAPDPIIELGEEYVYTTELVAFYRQPHNHRLVNAISD